MKPMTGGLPQWTPRELIAFEEDIAAKFNASKIKAPVHLYHGNEKEMIDVFKGVRAEDWVLCSWRSHYQCLLKGVPPEKLKAEIMAGHSMLFTFISAHIIPIFNCFSNVSKITSIIKNIWCCR